MSRFKPDSKAWYDQIETLRAHPHATTAELKDTLKLGKSHISDLQTLETCFDPAAIEKVRQAALGTPPFVLSFNSAKALGILKNRIPVAVQQAAPTPDPEHAAPAKPVGAGEVY